MRASSFVKGPLDDDGAVFAGAEEEALFAAAFGASCWGGGGWVFCAGGGGLLGAGDAVGAMLRKLD